MRLFVVGIGPGKESEMTLEAREILEEVDLIVGYTVYVELVQSVFPEKEYYTTGMRKEKDRVLYALEQAKTRDVALVCSGDSQIFGMAGLAYECAKEMTDVEVVTIPGITAAISGGAVLGAPLTHDFVVISLSDLLTPWEVIEKRLRAAGSADFTIALYNPSSHKRIDYLEKACEILLETRAESTVCGYVKNIGRDGQKNVLLTLGELKEETVDMFTTVFIGNSMTKNINQKMVTPRGYKDV